MNKKERENVTPVINGSALSCCFGLFLGLSLSHFIHFQHSNLLFIHLVLTLCDGCHKRYFLGC